MTPVLRRLICLLFVSLVVTGCYSKPVRHLASDAALIKVGESSREDVLTYLGEPDEQVIVSEGVEKWVFREYEASMMKNAPLIGKYFGPENYGVVTVFLKDNIVAKCLYGAYDHEELDWADDFDWQENAQ